MNRILITGGRGGIGRSLSQTLTASPENRIITLGRSATPEPTTDSENLTHLQGSILEEEFFCSLLKREKITHLIHTAGARTSECSSNPKAGFETNVLGAGRVFRAAASCPTLQKLIHFSSAAVYGSHSEKPTESSSIAPPTPYAITKAASEISALGHAENTDYATLVLRPGFVLGPYSKGTLSTFLKDALRGKEASLSFPDRFFLHWAPDLSRAVASLLREQSLGSWEVIHPPGIAVSLMELRSTIERFCSKTGQEPRFRTSSIPNTPFPSDLDQTKFEQLVPGFSTTPLSEMLNQMTFPGKELN